MNYTNKNIVINELIGLKVKVIKSKDKSKIGLIGDVIDETKNLLIIETKKGIKKIPKDGNEFKFYYKKKSFIVNGEEIAFRPFERTKKALKFYRMRRDDE